VRTLDSCVFCEVPDSLQIIGNNEAFVIEDKYPITKNHSLIIPRRHFSDFFEANVKEYAAILDLLKQRKQQLLELDDRIKGFNVGVNIGKVAGQAIFHCHIHLIPRRTGEIPNWDQN